MFQEPNTYTILGVIHLIIFIWALISILAGRGSAGHKILWILVILLFPCIGLIVYLIFGRSVADA